MHELREALGKDFSISVVILAQSEYLNSTHLKDVQDAVDWLTVLAYALDDQPHADPTNVDTSLNLLWSANLEPAKINVAIVNRDVDTRALELDLANKHCLGGTSLWVTNCDDNNASPQQPDGLDTLGPSLVVHPRSPQGIPTDPIVVTTSARGTGIRPSITYSNPPVISSVVVPSHHIITSVQGSTKPSSVVWSSQPTSQAASSPWVSSVQAPAPPSSAASSHWASSVQASALPSSAAWSSQSNSHAASSQWVSLVPAPAPPPSAAWSSQSTSQAASSPWSPAPSSSTAWGNQPSSQAGSSGVVPSHTASSVPGSLAAPSSGASSVAASSGAATSSNAWSSAWSSTASGSMSSSGVTASSVDRPSVSDSSGAWSSSGGSASPSSVWSNPAGSTTTAWFSGPPASSVLVPGSSVWPSGSFSTAQSSAQGSSVAQTSGVAVSSNSLTSVHGSSTPGGTIVFPPGSLISSNPSVTPIIPPGISGSSTHRSINSPIPIGTFSSSTPSGVVPVPIRTPTSSTPGGISPFPIGTTTSSTPGGVVPKPTGTSSSLRPVPTTTGCPKECGSLDWCKIYCESWPFPRPIDEQPPYECLLPENIPWCHPWWFGPIDVDGSDGDPDSHTDTDPDCKENNCVAECSMWRIATFLFFKRPVCPCIPKKCDKDGDSDSPSDSDKDDPKGVKPKPTSYPKPDNKKCKLLGCGCGWMGLGYGPGCPGNDFELNIPCGIFGCNPCTFFGSCPGAKQPDDSILGYGGYCRGAGCDPCPPELCNRPGCTIPGGCGPKPGPAPTRPSNEPDPDNCEDSQRTVITDRFIMCTKGFDVSAIPSTMWGTGSTSSTMVTSVCLPIIDATQTICGPAQGFDTTTTKTGTNTLTSDAPACTRAPLSLDDDEGNNNPDDSLFDTSSIFASNTTMFASSTSKVISSMTSRSSASSTPSAGPAPSHKPMNRNGHWKVEISQWMWDDYSEVSWKLYDPNGFHAGQHNTRGNKLEKMTDYIQSVNRPFGDSMPFGVDMTVSKRK